MMSGLVKRFFCFILIFSAEPSVAQENEGPLEVEAGLGIESLSKGYDSWKEYYVEVFKIKEDRKSFGFIARKTERFSLSDSEFTAVASWPLKDTISVSVEAGGSPGHRVLPKKKLSALVNLTFDEGWMGSVGYAHREYNTSDVDIGSFGMERYISNYRLAYTLFISKVDSADNELSHSVRVDRYYDEECMIGIGGTAGKESENLGGNSIITSSISSVYLMGRHWFDQYMGISYSLNFQKQGNIYDRYGIRAGLRFRF